MGFKKKPESPEQQEYTRTSEQQDQPGKVVLTDFKGRKKEYTTVAARLHEFWSNPNHEAWSIRTRILVSTDNSVVMRCVIKDANGHTVATGHAEEIRGTSDINTTSALENAETSAIGRALACMGIGGESFASADEIKNAQDTQAHLNEIRDKLLPDIEASAELGVDALQDAYENLDTESRRALQREMPRLKRVAEENDAAAEAALNGGGGGDGTQD